MSLCGLHMGPLPSGPSLPGWEEHVALGTRTEVRIYLHTPKSGSKRRGLFHLVDC